MQRYVKSFSDGTAQYVVAAIIILLLLPFLDKAFHIDDPLFIWSAKRILTHPFDFYGFPVNWYGSEMPMSSVMKNPPFTSYYLAATSRIFGLSEWSVHLSLVLPSLLAAFGISALAANFCKNHLLAVLTAVLTPAFLVSSTTAMSDIWLLAFCVWAMERWVVGVKSENYRIILVASLLATMAVLAKYSALFLFPLFCFYVLVNKRPWRLLITGSILPLLLLSCYQLGTAQLYGNGLLFDGAQYAVDVRFRGGSLVLSKTITGLSFMGGCFLTAFFFSPFVWGRRTWLAMSGLLCVLIIAIVQSESFLPFLYAEKGDWRWEVWAQLLFFVLAGLFCFELLFCEVRSPTADGLFLSAWVLSVFIFTCYLNWSVNVRSLILMIPALVLLCIRRVERVYLSVPNKNYWLLSVPLFCGAILSISVALGDMAQANSARKAALQITQKYRTSPLLFQGHWGFQYYMEEFGAKPLDLRDLSLVPNGAVIVLPSRNSNVYRLPTEGFLFLEQIRIETLPPVATLDGSVGAGFYADIYGPLPFAFSSSLFDEYSVFRKDAITP
jgi:4-amino-4-deoxy-L-arabinose transferase-like glycosyltransferase